VRFILLQWHDSRRGREAAQALGCSSWGRSPGLPNPPRRSRSPARPRRRPARSRPTGAADPGL